MPTHDGPDRFINHPGPGAHEWWYFDAISDDGRDALVIVWYAGLPFDPSYGVATLRHLRNPDRHPAPHALDHSAIGISWYRDGKTMAYGLNGHRRGAFQHEAEPFAVTVGESRVECDGDGYRLIVATSAVNGRTPIRAELRFCPSAETIPFERDLGGPEAPHLWILAAPDCRVEGRVGFGGTTLAFQGRGYHDHNAGAEEMSLAMRRWEWGRVHHGPFTEIYYDCEPHRGEPQSLWITCRDGRPETIREDAEFLGDRRDRTVFGMGHDRSLLVDSTEGRLVRQVRSRVDSGPFYLRWTADYTIRGSSQEAPEVGMGFAELLDTRNMNRPWFNWMIPYRLKWPRA
ncbi:hypothetical protein TA3x_004664 [Tundrisphaera sp. TA3]|uniref:hypothetical protein n=1 Tax=Tundrisphaera sp. TA3 TaxID=3435775 RepID=UPI003EBCF13A